MGYFVASSAAAGNCRIVLSTSNKAKHITKFFTFEVIIPATLLVRSAHPGRFSFF